MYRSCDCHVSVQIAGLETAVRGRQTPRSTARRELLDGLWDSHVQAVWGRIPDSDTASLLFSGSSVGRGLQDNAWGYVARQVIKDVREHLCNLLDTYLPRVVLRQVEEALRGREDVDARTKESVANLLLREIRSRGVEEEEEEEEEAGGGERPNRMTKAKALSSEPAVRAIASVHRIHAGAIVRHARERERKGKPAQNR